MLNFNHLRAFYEAARLLNVTKAAEALCITQPAVSHQIKLLEQYCKVKLFGKRGRRIYLTDEGKIIFQDASKIFEMGRNLEHRIDDIIGKSGGYLHIGCVTIYADSLLPVLLRKFHSAHKNIKIHVDKGSSLQMSNNLHDYKDSVVIIAKIRDDSNIRFIPLFQEELVLITPPDSIS